MREKKPVSGAACMLVGGLFVVLLVFLDQCTKVLAALYLKNQEPFPIIRDILELKYLYPENRGIAFGMFQGSVAFFTVINVLLLAGIICFFVYIPKERYYVPLMCVCVLMQAGAAGNLIDRIFRGYVIDFIYFELINFPVFNLADVYVVGGAVLLILLVMLKYRQDDDFDFITSKKKG